MSKKITLKIDVWARLAQYDQVNPVHFAAAAPGLEWMYNDNSVRVAESVEIEVEVASVTFTDVTLKTVEHLRQQQDEIRADMCKKLEAVEEQIQKLLALPAPGQEDVL